jgi:hypothetical protein
MNTFILYAANLMIAVSERFFQCAMQAHGTVEAMELLRVLLRYRTRKLNQIAAALSCTRLRSSQHR